MHVKIKLLVVRRQLTFRTWWIMIEAMDKNLQLFKLQRGSTDTGLQIIKCHISQAGSPADGFQNKINHMRQNVSGTYFKRADEVAEKKSFSFC
jgi:hypothetical protein